MARSYGKVMLTIWRDDDFCDLTSEAQRLYLFLISHPDLTPAGTIAYRPTKWAKTSSDLTLAKMHGAVGELMDREYVLVDHHVEELLVRSYIKNDEAYRSPNMLKALRAAIALVESEALRARAEWELANALGNDCENPPEPPPEAPSEPFTEPFPQGFPEPLGEGMGNNTTQRNSQHNTPSALRVEKDDDGFDEFWSAYPRKVGRAAARKAYTKALRDTTLDVILAALREQCPQWRDVKYTPHPSTWLNAGRWADEVTTARPPVDDYGLGYVMTNGWK